MDQDRQSDAATTDAETRRSIRRRSSDVAWRAAFDAIESAVCVLDPSLHVLDANDAFVELVGRSAEDLRGEPLPPTLRPPDAPRLERAEWRLELADRCFRARLSPARDERGAVRSAVLVLDDVSDLEWLKRELATRSEQLADGERQKDEFLAMLAHEIRNPLHAITAALHLLETSPQARACDRARDTMRRQLRHLAGLVDDLLDVSRLTRGTIELSREPIDLRAVVVDAIDACRPTLDARGIELDVRLGDAPLSVLADVMRLEQVVMNVLVNAATYSERGGVVTVALVPEVRAGGRWATLSVRDDGAGIPPEMLTRIFDLFVQVDPKIDRARGGLGIGLTVVRSVVAMHGGDVEAKSAGVGHGAEILVRLPLLDADALAFAVPQLATSGAGRRVVVVEDNDDAREMMVELLRQWGHDVRGTGDGRKGLDLVLSHRPDVALLDVGLPSMNGYEIAQRVRAAFGREVQLVAITGYGWPRDRARALGAGFDVHLVKPIDPDSLREALGRLAPGQARRD